MDIGFAEALLLLGLLLSLAAALSGWLHGTVLSISVLSVVAGLALAGLGIVSANPGAEIVVLLVQLALVLTLFSDGLFVERELLRVHSGPSARALVVAMPLTLVLLALAAKLLFPELSWTEAFLLGAVLSPTDPVVTSAVVTAERVPAVVRHTLNLEAVVGAVLGIALALAAGRLLARLPGQGMLRRYEGTYALGLGFVAFGLADATYGNGLIAAFVAGIALAVARREMPEVFLHFNEAVSAIFQVATFFVFGALIVATGWDGSTLSLIAFIAFALLVARPTAVLVSFVGVRMPLRHKLFIAWFGPKGVASMLFALFVLNSAAPDRTIVFDVASFVILASIMAHGLTDTVGSRWIERRL